MEKWFYAVNEQRLGPVDAETIARLIRAAQLSIAQQALQFLHRQRTDRRTGNMAIPLGSRLRRRQRRRLGNDRALGGSGAFDFDALRDDCGRDD